MALLVQTLLGLKRIIMRDIIVKQGLTYKATILNELGEELEVLNSLDDLLPIDRVVTIDNNSLVSLYDTCIVVTEDMIEKEL